MNHREQLRVTVLELPEHRAGAAWWQEDKRDSAPRPPGKVTQGVPERRAGPPCLHAAADGSGRSSPGPDPRGRPRDAHSLGCGL